MKCLNSARRGSVPPDYPNLFYPPDLIYGKMPVFKPDNRAIERVSTVYNDEGHTSIPKDIREPLGITEGDKLVWVAKNGCLMLAPAERDE